MDTHKEIEELRKLLHEAKDMVEEQRALVLQLQTELQVYSNPGKLFIGQTGFVEAPGKL